jgi:ORF6N domain
MESSTSLATIERIESKIHTIRRVRVVLDSDLAALYGVEARVLNQAVNRYKDRFPGDSFCI